MIRQANSSLKVSLSLLPLRVTCGSETTSGSRFRLRSTARRSNAHKRLAVVRSSKGSRLEVRVVELAAMASNERSHQGLLVTRKPRQVGRCDEIGAVFVVAGVVHGEADLVELSRPRRGRALRRPIAGPSRRRPDRASRARWLGRDRRALGRSNSGCTAWRWCGRAGLRLGYGRACRTRGLHEAPWARPTSRRCRAARRRC